MTIVIGNPSQAHSHSGVTRILWGHNNDGEYLVGVGGYNGGNPTNLFDGAGMTRRVEGVASGREVAVWTLDNPIVDTKNFLINPGSPSGYMHGGGLSLSGVDEAGSIRDATVVNNGTGAGPITITLTTLPGDICVIAVITDHGSGALVMTAGGSQTEFVTEINIPYSRLVASYKTAVSTSTTLTYTLDRSVNKWAIAAIAIKPLMPVIYSRNHIRPRSRGLVGVPISQLIEE